MAVSALWYGKGLQADAERRVLSIATTGGVGELKRMLDKLDKAKVAVESVELRRPTLDDVFLTLTGKNSATKAAKPKKGAKK